MQSNWESQLKLQIRNRYAQEYKVCNVSVEKIINSGYPKALLKNIPTKLIQNYHGCGFILDQVTLEGSETILDLGSGAGIDSYILANEVMHGTVISLDLTPSALSNHNKQNIFPLCADFEYIPLANNSIDLIIANASINLAVSKEKVFGEAHRVLKKNGTLIIRDLIKNKELPAEVYTDPLSYTTSLGGAISQDKISSIIESAGFGNILISDHKPFSFLKSVTIKAKKIS